MAGHERVAGLALLDRSAGHRLGGVRPRGREPEFAGPAAAGGAGGHRRARRAGRARQDRSAASSSSPARRRASSSAPTCASSSSSPSERAGDRERHAASTPTSTASSGCRCRSCAASTASASAAGSSWRSPATGASPRATTPRGSASPRCKLGIFPGFNGTARSIRQAGALAAMQMMLTGSMIRAGAARGMGLVDELVPSPLNLRWAARKAIERKRKSKPARLAGRTLLRHVAGARAAGQEVALRDRQEGARGALSRALPADRSVRDARRQPRGHEGGGDARLRAADAERHLAQPAPRVQAVRDDEGAGAQGPRLQAAARARDRRRRDGRRHRRLVRRLRHGGVAAGPERRADRQGHRRAEEAVRPQVQDQGAARRRHGAPDRRSRRAATSAAPTS